MSMVIGMAETQKVTVTLGTTQVAAIKDLVARGQSSSVSGFVQLAVDLALDDIRGWADMLRESLDATGGPATDAERAWAEDVLRRGGVT